VIRTVLVGTGRFVGWVVRVVAAALPGATMDTPRQAPAAPMDRREDYRP
jgi:hypothetical protein